MEMIIAINAVFVIVFLMICLRLLNYCKRYEELKKVRLHNETTWKKKV